MIPWMEFCWTGTKIRIGMFSCKQESGVEKTGEVLGEEVSNALVKGDKYDLYGALSVNMVKTVMRMFLHKDVKVSLTLMCRTSMMRI